MASANFGEDSESDRLLFSGRCTHRTRRRGTNVKRKEVVWQRDHEGYHYPDDDSFFLRDFQSREFNSLMPRNQERTWHSRGRGDNAREKYRRYGDRTSAGNSSRNFCPESVSNEFDFNFPLDSGREERVQGRLRDDFGFDKHDNYHKGRQHFSGRTKNASCHHDEIPWRGRGGRGRAKGSKRYSNRQENSAIFDWREGMTSTGK